MKKKQQKSFKITTNAHQRSVNKAIIRMLFINSLTMHEVSSIVSEDQCNPQETSQPASGHNLSLLPHSP